MSDTPAPAPGIDRAARDELIRLARALVAGESFVEDFQVEMFALTERTADRAVKELGLDLDGLYSDLDNHKLTGRYAITGERLKRVERTLLFLTTDLPYEWPDFPIRTPGVGCGLQLAVPVILLGLVLTGLLAIVNLGHSLTIAAGWLGSFLLLLLSFWVLTRKKNQAEQRMRSAFEAAGDFEVYPFLRRADYERALPLSTDGAP